MALTFVDNSPGRLVMRIGPTSKFWIRLTRGIAVVVLLFGILGSTQGLDRWTVTCDRGRDLCTVIDASIFPDVTKEVTAQALRAAVVVPILSDGKEEGGDLRLQDARETIGAYRFEQHQAAEVHAAADALNAFVLDGSLARVEIELSDWSRALIFFPFAGLAYLIGWWMSITTLTLDRNLGTFSVSRSFIMTRQKRGRLDSIMAVQCREARDDDYNLVLTFAKRRAIYVVRVHGLGRGNDLRAIVERFLASGTPPPPGTLSDREATLEELARG